MKKTLLFVGIFVLLIAGFTYIYKQEKLLSSQESLLKKTSLTISKKEKALIQDIKKYYSTDVQTKNEVKVYKKDGEKLEECGKIGKNVFLSLEPVENITKNSTYFQIKDKEYYIFYKDIWPVEDSKKDQSFKNYVPFNKSVVLKRVLLYNDSGLAFDLPEEFTAPILIDETDRKYIEYMGSLYYAKKEDVSIIENNEKREYATQMSVLNYHFFYNDASGGCNESICLKASKFEEQMKYLADNAYYTPSMKEFEMFLDKKIRLPKKSVMLTVDDGALGTETILPSVLEKYGKRASLFLITGWNDKNKFTSPSVELHSHSDAMHKSGVCPGGQGGGIKCLPKETVLADLKKTRDLLNQTTAFAYPFYEYNDRAISLLKEAGFTMAFVGGNKKAVPGINKMLIPRYPILSDITLDQFIKKIR